MANWKKIKKCDYFFKALYIQSSASSPLPLSSCFFSNQAFIDSLLLFLGLLHPMASYHPRLVFFLKKKLNAYLSEPRANLLFSTLFIHPPTSHSFSFFVLVSNSFSASSVFSFSAFFFFPCQWTDFFLSRSAAD